AISVEALEDHFGVVSNDRDGWIRAFDRGRARILDTARAYRAEQAERMAAQCRVGSAR
ncbi:DUF1488 domain-containing protein, partial [Mycetohabitans sp. B6]